MLYQKDEISLLNNDLSDDRNISSSNGNGNENNIVYENNKVVTNSGLDSSIDSGDEYGVNNIMNNVDLKVKSFAPNDRNHKNNKNQKYKKPEVKQSHQSLSLRVSRQQICTVIDAHPPRCTHFDALRFFTGPALPLNRILPVPTRILQMSSDQPGCLHVNMDLFKWAVKLYPFISSELIADTLALALQAREVDMRASPYDLKSYLHPSGDPRVGLGGDFNPNPIYIETSEGRKEYMRFQEDLYLKSQPIRLRLIENYRDILKYYD
jgi:hypothetical protein